MPRDQEDSYFQELYADAGFWSCCGYDGLSVAFDLPLASVRALPEEHKLALVHLIARLAHSDGNSLRSRVRSLDALSCEERLTELLRMSAR
jgi:hypothetical protein